MKLTSAFVLAAVLATGAVSALPFSSSPINAREVGAYDTTFEARGFQNKIQSEERTMDREAARIRAQEQRLHAQQKQVGLQEQIHADKKALRHDHAFAREFADEIELEARGQFQNKINSEQRTMDREAARIRAEQQRLRTQRKDVNLQEQIHADRKALHRDNTFGRREFIDEVEFEARGQFQNKINSEQRTMNGEAARIRAEQQRLNTQRKDVKLQEQIHADRNALHRDRAFGRREVDQLEARGQFQNKINSEQHTMDREAARIRAEQQRLATQRKDVNLQEQIHADRKALHRNNAFGRREYFDDVELEARGQFQNKINSEQRTMDREAARIRAEQQRLRTQRKDVNLQEQIHSDRKALHNDHAFGRRELADELELEARSQFQTKINSEQRTMDREAARIRAQEQRLHAQQKEVSLQEQIHTDKKALRKDSAFGRF